MSVSSPRYALYYAPEAKSDLWSFGSSVVGYDAVDGTEIGVPEFAGPLTSNWRELTS